MVAFDLDLKTDNCVELLMVTVVALTGEFQVNLASRFAGGGWRSSIEERYPRIFQMFFLLRCTTTAGKIWTHLALVDTNKYWTLEVFIG